MDNIYPIYKQVGCVVSALAPNCLLEPAHFYQTKPLHL